MVLTNDYIERVYAGVLGKNIGVHMGRPFEGWSYEKLTERFGEVDYYVHDQFGIPVVDNDDDITGTFTFLRAMSDNGNDPNLTPKQIGDTWLNYIVQDRTILWWGGMGISTEHTTYLRLKSGISAPASGSIALNSKEVAEQIGAQIFIDGWGMICPGDPELAAEFARRASSVSHDGEAIYGAQVVAAMAASAFVESDIDKLIDIAVSFIPKDSIIYQCIADIREWHAATPDDWRGTRAKIDEQYGYHRFGGACHIVPNHALIIHALLYGNGDFSRSLMIVNTCGWDTDCNSGNVGCILAIRGGLNVFEGDKDWRGPVADRIFLATADGGRYITDAVQETYRIVNIARGMNGHDSLSPKNGARFSFALPGSVQGFSAENAQIASVKSPIEPSVNCLAIRLNGVDSEKPVFLQTATFILPGQVSKTSYESVASPTIYPGQIIEARFVGDENAAITARLFARRYIDNDNLEILHGTSEQIASGSERTVRWTVPETGGQPIAMVGLEIVDAPDYPSTLILDYLTWSGSPNCELRKAEKGDMWQRAWVNAASRIEVGNADSIRVLQNEGSGMILQGTREWGNYTVSSRIRPGLCTSFGLAARVQGMRRYYALLLSHDGKAKLIKMLNEESVLAEVDFAWNFGERIALSITVTGCRIVAKVGDKLIGDITDNDNPLDVGAIGIVCADGNVEVESIQIRPL